MSELDWLDLAGCLDTDPEAFFPELGGSTKPAKRVCASCEVRAECLEYAIEHRFLHGVFGGMSERERRKILPGLKCRGEGCDNEVPFRRRSYCSAECNPNLAAKIRKNKGEAA